jgi:hypothetical protein
MAAILACQSPCQHTNAAAAPSQHTNATRKTRARSRVRGCRSGCCRSCLCSACSCPPTYPLHSTPAARHNTGHLLSIQGTTCDCSLGTTASVLQHTRQSDAVTTPPATHPCLCQHPCCQLLCLPLNAAGWHAWCWQRQLVTHHTCTLQPNKAAAAAAAAATGTPQHSMSAGPRAHFAGSL